MSELQTDDAVVDTADEYIEEVSTEETGTGETGAELDTASDGQHETQDQEGAEKTNGVQNAINKQYRLRKDEERLRIAAEEKLRQFESQQQNIAAPIVPDFPDEFDDNFETRKSEWIKATQARTIYDANQDFSQRQEQQRLVEQKQQQDQRYRNQADSYIERGIAAGISRDELILDADSVMANGLRGDISVALMNEPDGFLITKYLNQNTAQIDVINAMDGFGVGAYVASTIRPAVAKLKPRTTNAPPPATSVSGNGADPEQGKYPMLKGAKFE